MRASAVIALFSLFVLSCAVPRSATADPHRELDFETVFQGRVPPGLRLLGDHVFRDEQSWCAFWGRLVRGVVPPPPCARVDFRHEVVIASVAAGVCSDVEILSIERTGRRRAVTVLVEERVDPCPLLIVGDTGHAVVVSRPIREVEFVHEAAPLEGPDGR